ncbi:2-amino-4-hydroxy-6-hydroxymethyldihydropteridine diphosphokinase [Curvibacter sp. CHRR-16]|uniref:2-amino-4-hydroxy-6- hydroxymethyldihydropteridine diphosphokinase n=1 Tax=Curvibacter sp. CHRR-16 TaxID=2835872 RepID=UPI001BDB3425|nr:2-amino-4-hydroxy-6-hydroxymethyldihydropteridine diphosphokinase [Curvibacter sp. CHRR-16]MBT0569176.1 2-amino-4-hydroxy-6-hydroxymethyldihydropteridine diphosphokinase [Curvibacter sp. CHRR-16]
MSLGLAQAYCVQAYIGLGGNLAGAAGNAADTVRWALAQLANHPSMALLAQSALYGSSPVDAGGADYVNAVACVATDLAPLDLLHALQTLENQAGRERPYRNAPRTLDLDLLLYGDCHMDSVELTIPHPRMAERAFVLQPLADIAPHLVNPQALAHLRLSQGIWPL